MNVTIEFTEIEADFAHQAITNELRMVMISMKDPFLTDVQKRNVGFRIEHYQQILAKLAAS